MASVLKSVINDHDTGHARLTSLCRPLVTTGYPVSHNINEANTDSKILFKKYVWGKIRKCAEGRNTP